MNKKQNPYRLYLTEDQMPKQYYNLRADMKELPEPIIKVNTKITKKGKIIFTNLDTQN